MSGFRDCHTMNDLEYLGSQSAAADAVGVFSRQLVDSREEISRERSTLVDWKQKKADELDYKFNQLQAKLGILLHAISREKINPNA